VHSATGADELDGVALEQRRMLLLQDPALLAFVLQPPTLRDHGDVGRPVEQVTNKLGDVPVPAGDRDTAASGFEAVAGRAVEHVGAVVLEEPKNPLTDGNTSPTPVARTSRRASSRPSSAGTSNPSPSRPPAAVTRTCRSVAVG